MSLILTSIVAGVTALTGAAIAYRAFRTPIYPTIPSSLEETKSEAFDAAYGHASLIEAEVFKVPDESMKKALPKGVFAVVAPVPIKELNAYDVIAYLGDTRKGVVMTRFLRTFRNYLSVRSDDTSAFKTRNTEDLRKNDKYISYGLYRGKVVAYYDWLEARKAG